MAVVNGDEVLAASAAMTIGGAVTVIGSVSMTAVAGRTVAGGSPSAADVFYAYENIGFLTTSSSEAVSYAYENTGALTVSSADESDYAYESTVAGTGTVGFYIFGDVPRPPVGVEGNDEFYFFGDVGVSALPADQGDEFYWYEVVSIPVPEPDIDVPIFGTFESATLYGLAIRITQLDNAGQPTGSAVVSNSFSAVTFTPQYTDAQEIVIRNGEGLPVGTIEIPGVLERITLSVDICGLDGELRQLLAGGDLLATSPTELSWAASASNEAATAAVAIELWSEALSPVAPDGLAYPYYRWVFPYVEMWIDASDHLIQDGLLATRSLGDGWGNEAFGAGPTGDWSFVSNRPYQYARDTILPAVTVNA